MLTTLAVEERNGGGPFREFMRALRGDSVSVSIKECKELVVKEIIYKKRRKKIDLKKISIAAGNQRGCIICEPGIFKDGEEGLYRFSSPKFEARLCTNFALKCVRSMRKISRELKIGILDNSGSCIDILSDLLTLCDNISVVTSSIEEYEYVAEEILSDCGASFLLTVNTDILNDCDLLIAPERISAPLSLKSQSIVITAAEPSKPIGGQVYYKYKIRLPAEFEALKPKNMDEVYFGSALYTKGRQHMLGGIVPQLCTNAGTVQTANSIAALLDSLF